MKNGHHIFEQLSHSDIFRNYARAFNVATGLRLMLRPVESSNPAQHDGCHANPVCAMFAASSRTCASRLELPQHNPEAHTTQTMVCAAGLSVASVPVRSGERLLGFLQTEGVIVGEPSKQLLKRAAQQLRNLGTKVDMGKLKEAYLHANTVTSKIYNSALRMLTIFAEHLGLVANHLTLQSSNTEPEGVGKAREFIREHHREHLALTDVAHAVNMSTFYFCKMFKKTTGLSFTDYLAHLRIEKAKEMLAKPNVRISEVAFDVGFQSLAHFNRTFRRLLGESPSQYRVTLSQQWAQSNDHPKAGARLSMKNLN
jgi:AraC-like DNA-binding protein